jgi:hypothetical protein
LNNCWLALLQKQLDIDHGLAATEYLPKGHSILSLARMEAMGHDLIQLCDKLEPLGLVDYEIGIWEEEILTGRCSFSHHNVSCFNLKPQY